MTTLTAPTSFVADTATVLSRELRPTPAQPVLGRVQHDPGALFSGEQPAFRVV